MNFNKFNSSELKGYLTGLIFGDGYIDKGVTKRSFRLKTINLDWGEDIVEKLKSTTTFKVSSKIFPSSIRNGVKRNMYMEVYIKAHPYFSKKYHHFYDDVRGRCISDDSIQWLNPIGLAQWYFGDGYLTLVGKNSGHIVNRRIEIATDRYTKHDIEKLVLMLKERFNISASVIKRADLYRIRILCVSYETFMNTIYKYSPDSFKYKFNLAYEKQPKWMSDDFWAFQNTLTERDNPYKVMG